MKSISKYFKKCADIILNLEVFRLVYLVACFIHYMPFFISFITPAFKIFLIWGIIVLIYNFIFNKNFTLEKEDYLLFLFIVIGYIGCFVNINNNFIGNFASTSYIIPETFLMLSYSNKKTKNAIKELKLFSNIIVILTFVFSIISMLIYFSDICKIINFQGLDVLIGIYNGRLWGVYGNPNAFGHCCAISILFSILLITINKMLRNKKKNIIFNILNIIIQSSCLFLANSRTAILAIFLSLFIFYIGYIVFKSKKNEESIIHYIFNNKFKLLIYSICFIVILFFSSSLLKYTNSLSYTLLNYSENSVTTVEKTPSKNLNETISDEKEKIERTDYNNEISNGRFEIWNAGIKSFIKNPLFGVGIRNINYETNKYMSDYTVATNPTLSSNMHNLFLQILVGFGLISLLIIFIYLFIVFIKFIKYILLYDGNNGIYLAILGCFSILSCILIINMLDLNFLYFSSMIMFGRRLIKLVEDKNDKRKVLFLISDLGGGGAEKVLTDLTNNLNFSENEVEVKTIFNEGKYINELNKNIKYSYIVKKPTLWKKRIISRVIKYFPKKLVYNLFINENYDVEIAFLESLPAKLLSGSNSSATKIAWVHVDIFGLEDTIKLFGNTKKLTKAYQNFDRIICVSDSVKESFVKNTNLYQNTITIYNPIDKNQIIEKAKLKCDIKAEKKKFTMVTIGRLTAQKAYLRLCKVINKLVEDNKNIELWILGEGPEKEEIEKYIEDNKLNKYIKLLGFKDNPYSYLNQADLFVSSSIAEGYSLVLAEAMVLGKPVLSTNTTGPDNLLEHGKYGCIVDNSFDGLYNGLKDLIENPSKLKEIQKKVLLRQDFFKLEEKVEQVESLFSIKERINKESKLFCTVFTPSYNRAYILEKLYKSLQKQTCTDFEWVVVDDGSSDNTEELFKKWSKEKNKFKINYVKVQNGGKQKAINKGIDLAKGKMFFIVDSDDSLTEKAIERLKYYEKTINKYDDFAGISGLRGYTRENVIGKRNKNDYIDVTNLQRKEFNLTGDKAECYYLDLLKRYRFPEVNGEKFVTECIVWDKIAFEGYKIRWFNEIIYLGEYLEDGYTKKGNTLFAKNPIGYLLYIRNDDIYYPLNIKRKLGNYYRYYEIVKDKKTTQEIANDLLTSKSFLKIVIIINKFVNKIRGR